MRERVAALEAALAQADTCRSESAVQAICCRCWGDVEKAMIEVIKATEAQNVGDPTPVPGSMP
jgi:hypothetical protein